MKPFPEGLAPLRTSPLKPTKPSRKEARCDSAPSEARHPKP